MLALLVAATVWIRVTSYEAERAELRKTASWNETQSSPERVLSHGTPSGADSRDVVSESGQQTRVVNLTARERRYEELLRSAPPAAPAAPPAEPSLLDRVVAPFASALGMGRSPAAAPAAAPANARPPAPMTRPSSSDASQPARDSSQTTSRDPRDEQDEDTDVLPPTLQGAEFVPPQVHDGEETTFSVFVLDNLSGVRSVSGVVAGPSGAVQGFSCRREGESSRFTAKIMVPKDAAEGVYSVRYLTLTDNASNNVNLNAAQGALPGTASFRVVSASSDSSGPKLTGVRLDRIAMQAGDRNTVIVAAEDDGSGVAQVSGVFVSPSKTARIGFGCSPSSSDLWQCQVSPPACLDCGVWDLEQIQVTDKANNMATFRADNQIVAQTKLTISGESCDSAPPTLQALTLTPPVVSNAEGGTIRIEAIIADDGCGVASLSGQATPAGNLGGQRAHFSFDPSPDGRTFVGSISIPKHSAKGVWSISWIQALDKGHNLKAYSSSDPVISRVTFRVE